MLVLLITADLATSSRVSGAAARNGVSLVTAMQASSVDSAADKTPDLVTVDLSTPAVDVSSVVAQLRALPEPPAKIIAFGSHVHEALLQAARDAGCDQVFSRGQFFAKLDEILSKAGK